MDSVCVDKTFLLLYNPIFIVIEPKSVDFEFDGFEALFGLEVTETENHPNSLNNPIPHNPFYFIS